MVFMKQGAKCSSKCLVPFRLLNGKLWDPWINLFAGRRLGFSGTPSEVLPASKRLRWHGQHGRRVLACGMCLPLRYGSDPLRAWMWCQDSEYTSQCQGTEICDRWQMHVLLMLISRVVSLYCLGRCCQDGYLHIEPWDHVFRLFRAQKLEVAGCHQNRDTTHWLGVPGTVSSHTVVAERFRIVSPRWQKEFLGGNWLEELPL